MKYIKSRSAEGEPKPLTPTFALIKIQKSNYQPLSENKSVIGRNIVTKKPAISL